MSFGGYMKVYAKHPSHPYHTIWVKNDLKELQKFVGGYIEAVSVEPGITVICNEDGRIFDMAYNCAICGISFVGSILVVGTEGDEFTDVPDWAEEFLRENTED